MAHRSCVYARQTAGGWPALLATSALLTVSSPLFARAPAPAAAATSTSTSTSTTADASPAPFYNAFDADQPAALVQPIVQVGTMRETPVSYSSLPLQIEFSAPGEDLSQRQIAPNTPQPEPLRRALHVGDCEFELRTGPVSVSSHALYPDNHFYTVEDQILTGATLHADLVSYVFLSIATDLRAELGDGAERRACEAALRRQPLLIGKVSLDGSHLSAAAPDQQSLSFRKASDVKATTIYLTYDEASRSVVLRDSQGMTATIESPIYAVKSAASGYFDIDVRPELSLKAGPAPRPLLSRRERR
jgi:hypothetical protein